MQNPMVKRITAKSNRRITGYAMHLLRLRASF